MGNMLPVARQPRWLALDIMKTVAIMFMVLAHVAIMYGTTEAITSDFSFWLAFTAEGIGAPAFILAMGASIILAKKKSPTKIIQRGILLFIIGYLLNLLKFYPTIVWFKTFPEALFTETGRINDTAGLISFLLIGDILQFAGIAYVICALLYHWEWVANRFYIAGVVLAIPFFVLAPILYTENYTPTYYFLQFIYGLNYQVYFPLFPWLGFVFLGMSVGDWYKQWIGNAKKEKWILILLPISLVLIIIGYFLIKSDMPYYFGVDYYHRGIGAVIMYCGELFMFLVAYHYLAKQLSKRLRTFVMFCSRNVTLIYITQWVLVYWGWYFIPYNSQPWSMLRIYIVLYIIITLLFTWLIEYLLKKTKKE